VKRTILTLCVLSAIGGCKSSPLVLYNTSGEQRVWPYFLDQPIVLAFWDTGNLECLECLTGLNTLSMRQGPIHLVGICTSSDRIKANRWMQKERVRFEVIHDPEEELGRRLGVTSYPTFIFFGKNGEEIDRRLKIGTIQNWFDRERWRRRAVGEPEPPRY